MWILIFVSSWAKLSRLIRAQVYTLQLKPQSGRDLAPGKSHGIEQEVILKGVPVGKGHTVKMRFKISYQLDQEAREEQGTVPSLGIA